MADNLASPSLHEIARFSSHEESLISLTGPGGADLSLSELSINDLPSTSKPTSQPFSLFAQSMPTSVHDERQEQDLSEELQEEYSDEEEGDVPVGEERPAVGGPSASVRSRDERLQNDLYILRKINATFAQYNEALRETQTSTERVESQLKETNILLDKYVGLLWQTEQSSRLLFDPEFEGGEKDEEILEALRAEKEEKERREKLAREEAARLHQQRLEQERIEQEESRRKETEKAARNTAAIRGVRGVRGVRGIRPPTTGLARGGATESKVSPSSAIARGTSGLRKPQPISSRISSARGHLK
ncbi:hypothetical protein SISNIDRAFT_546403 [Sistotremastrum niveocremeum HHB9708]|uniref:DASH complex subunit DUO1 n=1 Tax=Sistotremastrum niveocremeum HHB9708 TaxID=1314777 RepID=A0A165A479_9AGAM|nr:hypothetical protein SISNIDRAFT_546403 [Sistotremastrum niveocremeum HHB9708]